MAYYQSQIDLVAGRIGKTSILMHYFKENLKALSDKIIEALPKLEDALALASQPLES